MAAVMGAIAQGVGDIAGNLWTTHEQELQGRAQMDFQREMSNTAYVRGVQDMKNAGLNPMLAYSQGGASTPSGAMGGVTNPNIGGAISSAAATQSQVAQKENIEADSDLKDAQRQATLATIPKATNDARLSAASAAAEEFRVQNLLEPERQYLTARASGEVSRSDVAKWQAFYAQDREGAEAALAKAKAAVATGAQDAQIKQELMKAKVAEGSADATIRLARAEATAREYQLPGLKVQKSIWEDPQYSRAAGLSNVFPGALGQVEGAFQLGSEIGKSVSTAVQGQTVGELANRVSRGVKRATGLGNQGGASGSWNYNPGKSPGYVHPH